MFYYYMDPTYILVLIGVVICMAASSKMNRTFQKYSRVRSHNGMTGREAAERILHSAGNLRCACRACIRQSDRSL